MSLGSFLFGGNPIYHQLPGSQGYINNVANQQLSDYKKGFAQKTAKHGLQAYLNGGDVGKDPGLASQFAYDDANNAANKKVDERNAMAAGALGGNPIAANLSAMDNARERDQGNSMIKAGQASGQYNKYLDLLQHGADTRNSFNQNRDQLQAGINQNAYSDYANSFNPGLQSGQTGGLFGYLNKFGQAGESLAKGAAGVAGLF